MLEDALQLAPDYADARIALARIAFFRGDAGSARRRLASVENHPDARQLAAQIEAAQADPSGPLWRLDTYYGHSRLGAGLDDWQEAGLAVGRRIGPRTTATASVRYYRRFGETDIQAELRGDRDLGSRGTLHLAAAATPDAVFRPEFMLEGGWSGPACAGSACLQPNILVRTANYTSGTVHTLRPGADLVLADDRVRVGAAWVRLQDENGRWLDGWTAHAQWQATSSLRVTAGFADAPETTGGVTMDVRTTSLGGRVRLDDRTGLGIALTREERPSYDRTQLLVSASRRF